MCRLNTKNHGGGVIDGQHLTPGCRGWHDSDFELSALAVWDGHERVGENLPDFALDGERLRKVVLHGNVGIAPDTVADGERDFLASERLGRIEADL